MTTKSQSDNSDDAQRHKKQGVLLALASTFIVLSTLLHGYIVVRYLRFRARVRVQASLVSLPRWGAEVQPELNDSAQSVIPLEEVVVHQTLSQQPASPPEQHRAFLLELPAELRIMIWSYFVPGVQSAWVSRNLRQTCRQINHEVEYEARQAFTHKINYLQMIASESSPYLKISFLPRTYHVEMVLQLPNLPPLQHTTTIIDAVALTFVKEFPLNTRSVKITLQPHPHGSPANFERYFDAVWGTFYAYLGRTASDAMEGKTDLQRLTVASGAPASLVPVLRCRGFRWRLNWLSLLGVVLQYDRDFQCTSAVALDPRQRCINLIGMILRIFYSRGCGKLYIRFQQ
jgi:hypothetical protein